MSVRMIAVSATSTSAATSSAPATGTTTTTTTTSASAGFSSISSECGVLSLSRGFFVLFACNGTPLLRVS
jgi:hypothetical protein